MPVIRNRNAGHPERPANFWLDYRNAEGKRIREPACGSNEHASRRLLAKRVKEIEAGTWQPSSVREDGKLTVAQVAERYFTMREADAEVSASSSRRAQQNVHDQKTRIETYCLPAIGERAAKDISRDDIKAIVGELVRAGRLAPRTVLHVYAGMRGVFAYALANEWIDRTPCTLRTSVMGELPKKRDKDPRWRKGAVLTRGALYQLLTDERVPFDRRMFYALLSVGGGMRFGEAAGRRVGDYDREAQPLGRLHVTTQYDDEALKGDGPAREVPVHPFLAAMLNAWLEWGFELTMGRAPRHDDWLVPSRRGRHRALKHMAHRLEEDLKRIGLPRWTPHNLRATFITLTQEDGGIKEILQCVTHKGASDVWGGYSRYPWSALCAEVSKLRLEVPAGRPAGRLGSGAHGAESGARSHFRSHPTRPDLQLVEIVQNSKRDGRDLKQGPGPENAIILEDFCETAIVAYLENRADLWGRSRAVTPGVTIQTADDARKTAEAILAGTELGGAQRASVAALLNALAVACVEVAATTDQRRDKGA